MKEEKERQERNEQKLPKALPRMQRRKTTRKKHGRRHVGKKEKNDEGSGEMQVRNEIIYEEEFRSSQKMAFGRKL